MKHSTTLLAAWLLSTATCFNLVPRDAKSAKVVGLNIERRNGVNPIAHDRLRRRAKTVQATLDNLETLYFANASLGTPEQRFRFHIDTGSSDLWANAKDSSLCTGRGRPCRSSGTYDANASSTYEYVNSEFNISYVDGSGASGDYAKDTFNMAGQTIDGLQFGIGYRSTSAEGILGIGYAINEVQVNRVGGKPYPNLPQMLVNDGLINTNAYSLWLNDLDASTGSILFGGVDSEKYHGTLSKLPIIPVQDNVYAEFVIAMTGLGVDGQKGSVYSGDNPVPVLLDSGSSLMYLPNNIVEKLYDQFEANYDSDQGAAFIDCAKANTNTTLDFTFSGITISVPMNELVIVAGSQGQYNDPLCIFGIGPNGGSTSVLGDTFLRSAYVVYDLDNNEIGLAQTNFNATRSQIAEIRSGEEGVPSATGVPSAVSTGATASGGARNGGQPSVTGSDASGAALPMVTAPAWLGSAALAGVGLLAFM